MHALGVVCSNTDNRYGSSLENHAAMQSPDKL